MHSLQSIHSMSTSKSNLVLEALCAVMLHTLLDTLMPSRASPTVVLDHGATVRPIEAIQALASEEVAARARKRSGSPYSLSRYQDLLFHKVALLSPVHLGVL